MLMKINKSNNCVIRIDVMFLCDLFVHLNELGKLDLIKKNNPEQLFFPIKCCYEFTTNLVKLYDIRVSYNEITKFNKLLEDFSNKYFLHKNKNEGNFEKDISAVVFSAMNLEKLLRGELGIQPIYLATGKKHYDVNLLIAAPDIMFPTLLEKFPHLDYDVVQCSLALAFSLPTACVLHIMKILEFLVREYCKKYIHPNELPKQDASLGIYLSKINRDDINKGLVDRLFSIKNHIRNPIVHPDINIDIQEAIAIHGEVLGAIELLLRDLQ